MPKELSPAARFLAAMEEVKQEDIEIFRSHCERKGPCTLCCRLGDGNYLLIHQTHDLLGIMGYELYFVSRTGGKFKHFEMFSSEEEAILVAITLLDTYNAERGA